MFDALLPPAPVGRTRPRRWRPVVAVLAAVVAGSGGCGGGSSTMPTPSTPPTSAPPAPAAGGTGWLCRPGAAGEASGQGKAGN
ncbi:MAG: hypothetical protein ACR2MN_01670, partial [Acidimicrobiales bacterium]